MDMLKVESTRSTHRSLYERQHVLPYGDTLHLAECGCPDNWSKKTRAADLVDMLFQQAFNRYQQGMLLPCRHLTIAYMLPHHNVVSYQTSACQSFLYSDSSMQSYFTSCLHLCSATLLH